MHQNNISDVMIGGDSGACTSGFVDELRSVGVTGGRNFQIIVPGLTFTCDGVVTQWRGVVRIEDESNPQPIELQVWRPTGDRTFILVGSNLLPLMEDSQGVSLLDYPVPEDDQIEVEPGDIIGAFYPENPHYRIQTAITNNPLATELYIVSSESPTCTFEVCDDVAIQENRVPQLQAILGR